MPVADEPTEVEVPRGAVPAEVRHVAEAIDLRDRAERNHPIFIIPAGLGIAEKFVETRGQVSVLKYFSDNLLRTEIFLELKYLELSVAHLSAQKPVYIRINVVELE